MEKNLSRNVYFILLALAGYLAAGWLILSRIPVSLPEEWFRCQLYEKTGFYCPGCGATRALHFLLNGNVLKSVYYHPIVFVAVVYAIPFLGSHTAAIFFHRRQLLLNYEGMQIRQWHFVLFILLFLLPCLVKNMIYLIFHIHVM